MYKKLSTVVGKRAADVDIVEGTPSMKSEPEKRPWRRTMRSRDQNLEVCLSSAILILPMLALNVVLICLVFINRMPDSNSSYFQNNGTATPLGRAYYVDSSSTTLVYIASLSSSLSALLISSAMFLFSFSLAKGLALDSDQVKATILPTPYQLGILIKMAEGRLMGLWSYFLYVCGSKKRRTTIIPALWHASRMMIA